MKNYELEKIAGITGSSKAAVSKALNHCFGVERERRERILEAARHEGIVREGSCRIYGIFPDRPLAFWTHVMEQMMPLYEGDIPCRFNICPHGSKPVLDAYLEEAAGLGADLLLIGGCPDEDALREISARIPVFFLFDRPALANTFSFSCDGYAEGAALRGRLSLGEDARLLILDDGSRTAQERIRGFLSQGGQAVCLPVEESEMSASRLARQIAAAEIAPPDVIYACTGSLRETALAASKLGMRGTVAAGHDAAGSGEIGGVRYAGLACDISTVCRAAMTAAEIYVKERRFPDHKHTVALLTLQ